MAITYLGEVQGNPSSLSALTIDFSGLSPQSGDFVVVNYGVTSNTDRTIGVSTSGYTEVAEPFFNDTKDINHSVSYKVIGSGETSVDIEYNPSTGSSASSGAVSVRVYRGVDPTNPLDVAAVLTGGTNGKLVNPGSITPATAGALILACGAGGSAETATQNYASSDLSDFTSNLRTFGVFGTILGMGHYAWTSGAFDGAAWTNSDSTGTDSWSCVVLALRPAAGGGSDDLTVGDLSTLSATVAAPILGQTHQLSASGMSSLQAAVGLPTLGQTHDLTVGDVATLQATIGAPTLSSGTTHDLTVGDLSTLAATVGAPILGQTHQLAAANLNTQPASAGAPGLGQTHQLTVGGASTLQATVGAPSLSSGGAHDLTVGDLSTQSAVIGAPSLGQTHQLGGASISSQPASIGAPSLGQTHVLVAANTETLAAFVGAPTLGQTHHLAVSGLSTLLALIGMPSLGGDYTTGTGSFGGRPMTFRVLNTQTDPVVLNAPRRIRFMRGRQ